jgi:hypothetical protein
VLGEALLIEGKNGNLDPVLLAVFEKEGNGQMDELGKLFLPVYFSNFFIDSRYRHRI